MTQLGDSGKPGYSYQAYDGTGNPNQMVEHYTAPSAIKIVTLGGWIGGWNDTVHARLAVFAEDGTLLGYSAEFIVANEGAAANGNVSLYTADLITPVVIQEGDGFYVGTIKNRDDACQWSTGSNAVSRYEARATYPDGPLGGVSGPVTVTRRIGQYVANYVPVATAWLRRSGAFVEADSVQVYRSGAWSQADSDQVLRTGVWVDAT